MLKQPLGNFARSRRDWTIEGLRYSSLINLGPGSNLVALYALNNNANDGSYLALWSILGYCTSDQQMMCANIYAGLQGSTGTGTDQQVLGNAAAIPGYGQITVNTSAGTTDSCLVFRADGKRWLQNGDIPVFILPPNSHVLVRAWQPIGLFSGGTVSAVTFCWGLYATGKMPKLPALATGAQRRA